MVLGKIFKKEKDLYTIPYQNILKYQLLCKHQILGEEIYFIRDFHAPLSGSNYLK